MFTLKSKFDFKISIYKHIVSLAPGKQISIKVGVEKLRGKPQPVSLDVNTRWESVGLTAQVLPPVIDTGKPWEATMMIRASVNTPPGSYLFTVRGGTNGTFNTSEDAVTVIVDPKAEQREDEEDNIQPKQSKRSVSASASPFGSDSQPGSDAGRSGSGLDNLFAPQNQAIPAGTKKGTANPDNNSAIGWAVAIIISLGIFSALAVNSGIFDGGGGGGAYKCTCQNGSICTKNSDCPYLAPGVPGPCGCPAR